MTTTINITGRRTSGRIAMPRISVFAMLSVWKERRELSRMSDSRLSDIGISPADAATEVARPFWDLPKCRR